VELLLLDLKMPVMGGEEVLQITRERHPHIPVVIITGHGTVDTAVQCMKKGAYDFITKPCGIEEIVSKIESAFERKKSRLGKDQLNPKSLRDGKALAVTIYNLFI